MKQMVIKVLKNNQDPTKMNKTFISLNPKGKNTSSSKYFRPIDLCNVIMKLVTEVIANTIKSILQVILDTEQSAFMKGRMITDNALISLE